MVDVTGTGAASPTTYMLSTSDNPFNPFTDWDEWYAYDESKGYHSSALLARIANTSDELSEPDQLLAIEQAIDDVIAINDIGLYIKVAQNIE